MIPDQRTVLLHQRHVGVFPSEDAGKNCLSNVSIVSFVSICQAFFFLAAKYAHLYKQRDPMNKFEKQLEKWNKGILRGAQAKLAKTLGVSTATTALWTTGKRSPSKGYVEQMAKLFDMDALDVYKLFDRRSVIYPDPPNVSSARMLHDRHSNEFGYNMQPHSINEEKTEPSNSVQLPFLNEVPSNVEEHNENDILEWWSVPRRFAQGSKCILRASQIGLQHVSSDDLCFIKPFTREQENEWVVFRTPTGQHVCRQIRLHKGQTLYCQPESQNGQKQKPGRPIGVVIKLIRQL